MRLEYLPRELVNEVTRPLDKKDLLTLCLVSKRFLPLFRPYLFHTVKRLVISGTWIREEVEDGSRETIRRNSFFRNLDAFPLLAASISHLWLVIDPHSLITSKAVRQNKYDLTEKTIKFLTACVNLRKLTLELPGGSGTGEVPFVILDAIPLHLAVLDIHNSPLGITGFAYLLSRLSSLSELDLSQSSPIESYALKLPVFNHPIKIRLPDDKARLYPFITDILTSFPNLHSFHSGPDGLMLLAQSYNPHLRTLNVGGKAVWNTLQCLNSVVSILKTTCDLENLVLWLGPDVHGDQHSIPVDIVQALPPRLKTLRLVGNHLFRRSSLLDYLRSDRSKSLEYVRITRFLERGAPWDAEKTEEEVEVEELCRRRGARFRWMDEWCYW